jgi:hypothetical protein
MFSNRKYWSSGEISTYFNSLQEKRTFPRADAEIRLSPVANFAAMSFHNASVCPVVTQTSPDRSGACDSTQRGFHSPLRCG